MGGAEAGPPSHAGRAGHVVRSQREPGRNVVSFYLTVVLSRSGWRHMGGTG